MLLLIRSPESKEIMMYQSISPLSNPNIKYFRPVFSPTLSGLVVQKESQFTIVLLLGNSLMPKTLTSRQYWSTGVKFLKLSQ